MADSQQPTEESTPALWDAEHDTYTPAGDEFRIAIHDAVRPIIKPIMEQFVDAAHAETLAIHAVQHVISEQWNRRNDYA